MKKSSQLSFAVHQDVSVKATDLALGWGIAIGSPLRSEYCSDERGILLGAVHGIVESLSRLYQRQGMSPEDAFLNSSESTTGNIVNIIYTQDPKAVYDKLSPEEKKIFQTAHFASYKPAKEILQEIYDEVSSGNEIRTVIMHGQRLDKYPVGKIDGTESMFCYIHPYSEVVNESVIEAVPVLALPRCSIHGRQLLAVFRKWAPRFGYIFDQLAYTAVDTGVPIDNALIADFETTRFTMP